MVWEIWRVLCSSYFGTFCASFFVSICGRFFVRFWDHFGRLLGTQVGHFWCQFWVDFCMSFQERPRAPQERPRVAQERPTDAQEHPRHAKECPEGCQNHPKVRSESPKDQFSARSWWEAVCERLLDRCCVFFSLRALCVHVENLIKT